MNEIVCDDYCPYDRYKGQSCQCFACRVIDLCVEPGDGGDPCIVCDGPVQDCDPLEGLDEES